MFVDRVAGFVVSWMSLCLSILDRVMLMRTKMCVAAAVWALAVFVVCVQMACGQDGGAFGRAVLERPASIAAVPAGWADGPTDPRWGPPWDPNAVRWRHAKGRALLSTMTPLLAGSILFRVAEEVHPSRFGPLRVAGTCVWTTGLIVGPSTGLWCTGNMRRGWLDMGVRTAGVVGMAGGAALAVEHSRDEGIAAIFTLPLRIVVYILPGFGLTMFGIQRSLEATPDRFCDGREQRVTVSPVRIPVGGGRAATGLGVRVRLR
jgi:hypothetical protein